MTISEQYRAVKEGAAIGAVASRAAVGLTGRDRASYLHGLLTNDIQGLAAGGGCYAAWLTPQGRMVIDLHVFESGDMVLLDVPARHAEATVRRLDQFLFSEDVQIADLSASLRAVWLHGPGSAGILDRLLPGGGGFAGWPEYRNARLALDGSAVVVARVDQLGVPGFCIYVDPAQEERVGRALQGAGAVPVEAPALEAARIEAGYPLFDIDMTGDTIPLEAGIEARAISFTKGCYVGQEVIIRVLHRGQGRVARKLVALRVEGGVPPAGARLTAGEREIGTITSAADSPRLGAIALGYVHRDFMAAGSRVDVDTPEGKAPATVSDRPMP